jgi:pyrroline-5-carboxylate reductase
MHRLQIIGGGRMGEALARGLLSSGWQASELAVVEALAPRRAVLTDALPGVSVLDHPVAAQGIVVAVKPADVPGAVTTAVAAGANRVLSIAAGVTIATLEAAAGSGATVVRAMPNTPAQIGIGASAIAAGTTAGPDDLDWAEEILGAVGKVVRVTERQLDAVTGLSGSGPAYVFLVAEALIEAGVLVGLTREVATTLAIETLHGAGALLAAGTDSPEALRAAVTSPGGTTAAGLRALEAAGVRSAFIDAVVAASERATELGRSSG